MQIAPTYKVNIYAIVRVFNRYGAFEKKLRLNKNDLI